MFESPRPRGTPLDKRAFQSEPLKAIQRQTSESSDIAWNFLNAISESSALIVLTQIFRGKSSQQLRKKFNAIDLRNSLRFLYKLIMRTCTIVTFTCLLRGSYDHASWSKNISWWKKSCVFISVKQKTTKLWLSTGKGRSKCHSVFENWKMWRLTVKPKNAGANEGRIAENTNTSLWEIPRAAFSPNEQCGQSWGLALFQKKFRNRAHLYS